MSYSHWPRLDIIAGLCALVGLGGTACSGTSETDAAPLFSGCLAGPTIYGPVDPDWSMDFGNGAEGALAIDPNGNIVVSGSFVGTLSIGSRIVTHALNPSYAAFVLEFDPSGHLLWERTVDNVQAPQGLAVDGGGNVHLAANVMIDFSTILHAVSLTQYNGTGNLLSSLTLNGLRLPFSGSRPLAVSPSGDLALMAIADESNDVGIQSPNHIWPVGAVLVFDSSGRVRWNRSFPIEHFSEDPVSVDFDVNGAVTVAGTFSGTLSWGSPSLTASSSAFAAKLDAAGSLLWQRALGDFSSATAIAAGRETLVGGGFRGAVAVGDRQATAQGLQDLFLTAIDDQGRARYLTTVPASDEIDALRADRDGGLIAFGSINDYLDFGGGLLDPAGVFLAKLDENGRHVFSARFGSLGSYATALAVDDAGGIIVLGAFSDAIDLGTGILKTTAAERQNFLSRMFVARFVEGAPPDAVSSGASCVPPVNTNDPEPTLANGQLLGYPQVLALQGAEVYWATQTEILKTPITGGVAPAVVAHGQKAVTDLVVDDRAVYWATRGTAEDGPGNDGTIFMQPRQGLVPVILADHLDAPRALAVDGTRVYWTGGRDQSVPEDPPAGVVMSVSSSGGPASVLASGFFATGPIAARGESVVFAAKPAGSLLLADSTQILRIDANGETRMLASTDHEVTSIVLDDVNVYWLDAATQYIEDVGNDGRIRSVPLAGGDASILADRLTAPLDLVQIGNDLLWASFGRPFDGVVWRMPKTGGTPTAEISHPGAIERLAVDPGHLAWVEFPGLGSQGSVLRIRQR